MNKVVVVVFLHSETPTSLELISFKQAYKILSKHSIFVICPDSIDTKNYDSVINNIRYIKIPGHWQDSIQSYNKLKLSRFLYQIFADYEFLLTYELDAFVFKDELLDWCDKGFDFIGAPWFKGLSDPTIPYEFLGVGNSGFSLRRISRMREILKRNYLPKPTLKDFVRLEFKKICRYYYGSVKNLGRENYTIQKYVSTPEDLFIYEYGMKYEIAIPKPDIAMQFSFEVNPSLLYSMNMMNLPFGCHAWARYELEFWKSVLANFGFEINLVTAAK